MKHWKATIKERNKNGLLTPSYIGNVTKEFLIDFWGLNEPDVEWYEIHEIKEELD